MTLFTDIIIREMDKTAPKLKRRVRHKKQPKWLTKEIEDFIKKRNLKCIRNHLILFLNIVKITLVNDKILVKAMFGLLK